MDLIGLPGGELNLSITAEDVLGNTDTKEVSFVYDELPTLTIHEPIEFSVARPTIRVRLECSDDGEENCQIKVEVPGLLDPPPIQSAEGQIDEFIDLSRFDHGIVLLRFEAIDLTGRVVFEERHILVESSQRLTPLRRIPGRILQVASDRVLCTDSSGYTASLKIFNRQTEETDLIFNEPGGEIHQTYLTPNGVIFTRQSFDDQTKSVLEIRGDELINLGTIGSHHTLVVNGPYAIWVAEEENQLIRRDLLTGTNIEISKQVITRYNDITAEGIVAYANNENEVFLFKDGASRQVTQYDERQKSNPQTDGHTVVYAKHSPIGRDGGTLGHCPV